MNTRHPLHLLFASATVVMLCACQQATPVAGNAPARSAIPSPNDRIAPTWSSNAGGAATVVQPSGGLAASGYGQLPPSAQAAPGPAGQAGMPPQAYVGSAPSRDQFDHGVPANPAGSMSGEFPQNPAPNGVTGGQWQGASTVQAPAGAAGGQWQRASPAQVQAMTPDQQAAFYQRAEIERGRVHDDVIERIRQDEISPE